MRWHRRNGCSCQKDQNCTRSSFGSWETVCHSSPSIWQIWTKSNSLYLLDSLKTSFFKWKPNYLLAEKKFSDAALNFKLAGDVKRAMKYYLEAAKYSVHVSMLLALVQARENSINTWQTGVQAGYNCCILWKGCKGAVRLHLIIVQIFYPHASFPTSLLDICLCGADWSESKGQDRARERRWFDGINHNMKWSHTESWNAITRSAGSIPTFFDTCKNRSICVYTRRLSGKSGWTVLKKWISPGCRSQSYNADGWVRFPAILRLARYLPYGLALQTLQQLYSTRVDFSTEMAQGRTDKALATIMKAFNVVGKGVVSDRVLRHGCRDGLLCRQYCRADTFFCSLCRWAKTPCSSASASWLSMRSECLPFIRPQIFYP